MHQNRIYHYTSVESLAMILSTRKLRFTRLDGVDDLHEAQTHMGVNWGRYFFVSCWTQQAEESIPQWSLYGHDMRGVRIELRDYPFRNEPLQARKEWTGIQFNGEIVSPIPFEDLWGESYFIVPMFFNSDFFAGPVDYVPNVYEAYAHAIRRETQPDGSVALRIDGLPQLSRKKSAEWEFQREYRFSLFATPSRPAPRDGPGSKEFAKTMGQYMSNSLINNVDPGITHIDVTLAPDVFDDAVIRLGPLASPGSRVCVESLLARFAPSARIENSSLAVRARGR